MTAGDGHGTARGALDATRRHQSPQLALVYGMNGSGAVEMRGEGARLLLSDGRSALDFGSYAVTLLGQRHPAVVDAVRRELDAMPVSTRVLANRTTAELARRLADWGAPGQLTKVWLGTNGSDAVEAALKLARLATGRTRVLAVEGAYHGKSLGALAATWNARHRRGLEPLLGGVTHIAADPAAVAAAFADGGVAAVLVEPVQGEGGVRPLEPGLLRALADAAHAHGAFVIADEIQTGLRRCGPRLVSTDVGIRPDAVLLGKALGGGVQPLSAVLATPELYAPLTADPFVHTTTFSGHPLGAAAGLAALTAVEELAPRGAALGRLFAEGLTRIAGRHPGLVTHVRGRGLLWGVEFATPAAAGEVLMELGRKGLVVSPCLGRPQVLRLLPPLVASDEEAEEALAILDSVCAAVPDEFRPPGVGASAVTTAPTPRSVPMPDTGPHTAEKEHGTGGVPEPERTPGAGSPAGQRDAQYRYHRELFPALHDWERTERSVVEFSGEEGPAGLLGIDQMGHFGPQGCDLVAGAVIARGGGPLDLCELGSGFGGALRHMVDRIAAGGLTVRRAHGVDLVPEHCAVSRSINRAQGRTGITDICASATAVPLADASLDVVLVTGSMPHFPAPGEVLREAGRLLRSGGLLVLTEEVSLTPGGEEPSEAFRATHPRGVFFTTPLDVRLRELERAGFADVVRTDLAQWAVALLTDRLKAVRIFRGSVAGIYGAGPTDLIRDTLEAARTEFLAARLSPALITARRA